MPMSIQRLGAAALAASMLFAGVDASAQTTQPKPPAQRPAQQQPAQQPQQQQQQGPLRVELQPTQGDWTKVCGKDPAANKEICYTTRDFGTAADQPPVLALAVYDVKGDDQRIVRLLLPVALLLRPGFRFSVDKGATQEGGFEICFPNGCFAEAKVKGPSIDQMKKGTVMNVAVKNQANNEVTFALPLAGFAKAFDGAPIDPKVLEDQQKRLEQELQKRAEEQRKQLESQQSATPPK
ncbi:MAG: invasion associated locus B family protein [Beijerinckiaceae bacterium]|nr:invasion associated locus B family protein [Beijerinckiaceae bacterium]